MNSQSNTHSESETGDWMVTQVQAQLDEMAGACNELQRKGRSIRFIVPLLSPEVSGYERMTSSVAIFSVPKGSDE